ncbi:MAG TPA: hypothetical protein EYP30_08120, partial [Archaeoglobaceae archaeon]|nr:hypothetical protein [Archaeoglobaceae archaeon]
MGWSYRALREKLNEFEPRKTYTIHISELKTFKRGEYTAQEAVKALVLPDFWDTFLALSIKELISSTI